MRTPLRPLSVLIVCLAAQAPLPALAARGNQPGTYVPDPSGWNQYVYTHDGDWKRETFYVMGDADGSPLFKLTATGETSFTATPTDYVLGHVTRNKLHHGAVVDKNGNVLGIAYKTDGLGKILAIRNNPNAKSAVGATATDKINAILNNPDAEGDYAGGLVTGINVAVPPVVPGSPLNPTPIPTPNPAPLPPAPNHPTPAPNQPPAPVDPATITTDAQFGALKPEQQDALCNQQRPSPNTTIEVNCDLKNVNSLDAFLKLTNTFTKERKMSLLNRMDPMQRGQVCAPFNRKGDGSIGVAPSSDDSFQALGQDTSACAGISNPAARQECLSKIRALKTKNQPAASLPTGADDIRDACVAFINHGTVSPDRNNASTTIPPLEHDGGAGGSTPKPDGNFQTNLANGIGFGAAGLVLGSFFGGPLVMAAVALTIGLAAFYASKTINTPKDDKKKDK